MSLSSIDRVPAHLKKFTSAQNYDLYTPEEQATWRYVLRQLKDFLQEHAHSCYADGLKKTGISINSIPKINEMDLLLQDFGWGAVPVSGFIPPAAFMEFQSLSILPIASDMRTIEHLLYTPAPDIVHEAAGHAPILIHPEYADYLKSYAKVAKKSIISREDLNQYEAIRKLSDIKESPHSSKEDVRKAEEKLISVNQQISHVSEAALLSRMNWWTAEYGLIGDLKNPKIYGAGLLSSLGESRECLSDKVKKVPLDVSCVDVSYDITEPQPQLFVTPDFKTLNAVLDEFSQRLSYRRGGAFGLDMAIRAQNPNTVELDSGIQISGVLESYTANGEQIEFLKFKGPCQLSLCDQQLSGHGPDFHKSGYSSPIGPLKSIGKALSHASSEELKRIGVQLQNQIRLEYASGIVIEGKVVDLKFHNDRLVLISLNEASANLGGTVLFAPSWGQYDVVCGQSVVSVFGGPADRLQYGELEDFVAERVPVKNYPEPVRERFALYSQLSDLRKNSNSVKDSLQKLWTEFLELKEPSWLLAIEILELAEKNSDSALSEKVLAHLQSLPSDTQFLVNDGIRLSRFL